MEEKVKIVCKAEHEGQCPFENKIGTIFMYWNDDCVGVQVEGIDNLCFFNIKDLEPVETQNPDDL